MQVTGGRKFLELPSIQGQTHKAYEPHSLKADQKPKSCPGLGSSEGTEMPHRGVNLEKDADGPRSAFL